MRVERGGRGVMCCQILALEVLAFFFFFGAAAAAIAAALVSLA